MASLTDPALVIGYGSIGRRHREVLQDLGCTVAIQTRRVAAVRSEEGPAYGTLSEAISRHSPRYVVIADETSRHGSTLMALAKAGFTGRVLVEKPLFTSIEPLPPLPFLSVHVGYNLRFHPAVEAFRAELADRSALSVAATAGQFLPDWRPGTDYRQSYSAKAAKGGGVLRDLSHEIDLLLWLFGPAKRVIADGGKTSDLEITSDDLWSVMMHQSRSRVTSLHLDYLHRPGRRHLTAITSDRTLDLDLMASTLSINGRTLSVSAARDDSYREMHRVILTEGGGSACDLAGGLAVLRCIGAVEASAASKSWRDL